VIRGGRRGKSHGCVASGLVRCHWSDWAGGRDGVHPFLLQNGATLAAGAQTKLLNCDEARRRGQRGEAAGARFKNFWRD